MHCRSRSAVGGGRPQIGHTAATKPKTAHVRGGAGRREVPLGPRRSRAAKVRRKGMLVLGFVIALAFAEQASATALAGLKQAGAQELLQLRANIEGGERN
ncbi:hypothetical protein ERJ75_000512700 [Trypanosoma vivax]|nr:hypothetical protein ERJ75_000512700 [Trypanosoma vivax]